MVHALAGAAAGGALGAVSFWVYHTIWILDIPAVLLDGLVLGPLTAVALGWAFHTLVRDGHLRDGPGGGLVLGVVLWLLLAPFEIAGVVLGPFPEITGAADVLAVIGWILVCSLPIGIVAWLWTRSPRATKIVSFAFFVALFEMGGSLIHFGGRGAMLVLYFWLLPTFLVAGLTLVAVRSLLARRADSAARPLSRSKDVKP